MEDAKTLIFEIEIKGISDLSSDIYSRKREWEVVFLVTFLA
jgi:hypothetical protein